MYKPLYFLLPFLQIGKRSIFITGHGRSGTTWIGNIFKQAPGVLYYNEPCNPVNAGSGDYRDWFKYVNPTGNDSFFESCLDPAFRGLISSGCTWYGQRSYRRFFPGYRIVIKEVASVTSIEWVYRRYRPAVLIVIRHPCAVALSERNKATPIDRPIIEMLKQNSLVKDHLKPYLSVMEQAREPFEIYGVIWGARNRVIANLIPQYPEWKIIFYEDLCQDPIRCFRDLFDHFNLCWNENVQSFITHTTTEEEPGTYSIKRITEKQINKWKSEMTKNEIEQVRRFVKPFKLPFYNIETNLV